MGMTGLQFRKRMPMSVLFIRQIMVMHMRMRDGMGVGCAIMGMSKCVGVFMGMITQQSICYHKRRTRKHDDKGQTIAPGKLLTKEYKRQKGSDKGRDCVIRACFCCAQLVLGAHIEEDT